jgi:hypothetical protein
MYFVFCNLRITEDAEKFKQYCERQTGRKYEIYKIEKLKKQKIKSNGNQ